MPKREEKVYQDPPIVSSLFEARKRAALLFAGRRSKGGG
jgi:hypothetical protein